MMLLDFLHNIFNASGGYPPPSAAAAAAYAMSVGQMFAQRGATDEELADIYKYSFGRAFGWTEAETDRFWNDPSLHSWSDDDVHAYDAYVDWKRAYDIERNKEIMRNP